MSYKIEILEMLDKAVVKHEEKPLPLDGKQVMWKGGAMVVKLTFWRMIMGIELVGVTCFFK